MAKEEAAKVKKRISSLKAALEDYRNLIHAFKDIGDGLAYTYLNKWDIKPMSFKESPGFISGKKSNRLERRVLRGAFEANGIALMNDLTNCLRYGDLTIPRGDAFMLLELKSGKHRTERDARQMAASKLITGYLDNDVATGLYELPHPICRQSLTTQESDHLEALNKLISKSDGNVFEVVEPGIVYGILRDDNFDDLAPLMLEMSKPLCSIVNQSKYQNTGYSPFTLSIKDPSHVMDFYEGLFTIVVVLDLGLMEQKLRSDGWIMTVLDDEDWMLHLVEANPEDIQPMESKASRHFFLRIILEFLSLEWFLREISSMPTPGDLIELHAIANDPTNTRAE